MDGDVRTHRGLVSPGEADTCPSHFPKRLHVDFIYLPLRLPEGGALFRDVETKAQASSGRGHSSHRWRGSRLRPGSRGRASR